MVACFALPQTAKACQVQQIVLRIDYHAPLEQYEYQERCVLLIGWAHDGGRNLQTSQKGEPRPPAHPPPPPPPAPPPPPPPTPLPPPHPPHLPLASVCKPLALISWGHLIIRMVVSEDTTLKHPPLEGILFVPVLCHHAAKIGHPSLCNTSPKGTIVDSIHQSYQCIYSKQENAVSLYDTVCESIMFIQAQKYINKACRLEDH